MRSPKVGSPLVAAPVLKAQQLHQPAANSDAGAAEDSVFVSAFYEPTSVLDPHLSSSPAASDPLLLLDVPALSSSCWDDPPLSSSPSSDDWDPVTWLLGGAGEKDDPAPPSSYKPFHQFLDSHAQAGTLQPSSALLPFPFSDAFSPVTVDHVKDPCFDPSASLLPSSPPPPDGSTFDDVHLIQLARAAQAVESNDISSANVILARLNQPLAAPTGRPIQRAACYFHDALQSLLNSPAPHHHHHYPQPTLLTPLELIHKITAYRDFSDVSPVPWFTSFTANQIILEAVDSSRSVHLIDFDIGLGGQWSSFLHELAERCHVTRAPSPSVRLTAVVPEESLETRLLAENLHEFARGLCLGFAIDFVAVGSIGLSALGAIRLGAGDCVAVSFTAASFRLFGSSPESVARFLRFIRRVSPRVAVFVDRETSCRTSPAQPPPPPPPPQSFRRGFTAGLEHYTALLASLDAAAQVVGCGDDLVWRIERMLVRPRIAAAVATSLLFGGSLPWKEVFEAAGMKAVPFSEFTESQAEWLTRRTPCGGFQVGRRDWSLVLSWQGKVLAATSAWRW